MHSPLRFAVIGRNFVAEDFLAAGMRDDVRLHAVYSRNEDTARAFAQKHGAARCYTDLSALAADKDVDFVYIASPNLCHEAQTIEMLRGGKHVLVEKPAAIDVSAFRRMLSYASDRGLVLMEAMMSVHMPALRQGKAWLPRLGTIRGGTIGFCQYSSRYDKFKRGIVENAFDPTLGNGALMDIGVYCVEMMTYLAGEPQSVRCDSVFLPQSIDGCGVIRASFPDALWTLTYSKIDDGALPCEVRGENGRMFFDRASRPREVTLILRDGTHETFTTPPGLPDMAYELADLLACVRGEAIAEPYVRATETALAVIDKAREDAGIDFQKH